MEAQLLKLSVVTVCLIIAAGCAAPAAAPEPPTATPLPPTPLAPEGMDVVRAWADAIYRGDVAAALSYFTDNGNYLLEEPAYGKDRMRQVFNWLAGLETKWEFLECQPDGDTITCSTIVLDGCRAASAPTGLPVKATFTLQDGKIKSVKGSSAGPEWNDYWSFFGAVRSWASDNRARELASLDYLLTPEDRLPQSDRDKTAGMLMVKLCQEYGASLKSAASKQVLLVAQEQSEDMELMLTKEVGVMVSVLEKAGYKVVVASATGQPITGGATTLKPDMKLADVKVDDYVGFVFPCMAVPLDPPRPPAEALEIAKKAVAQGKPVAAQVGGVVLLGMAGVLDGKQFALFDELASLVPKGIYKGDGVVQDRNIVTSGICPYMAKMTGRTDGTSELTQKLIDALAVSQK